jgi:hypothetical protein
MSSETATATGVAAVTVAAGVILPPEIALVWYLVIGSFLGSIIGAAISQMAKRAAVSAWQMALRVIVGVAFAVPAAPATIRWRELDASPEIVLGISAAIGASAYIVMQLVASVSTDELREMIVRFWPWRGGK